MHVGFTQDQNAPTPTSDLEHLLNKLGVAWSGGTCLSRLSLPIVNTWSVLMQGGGGLPRLIHLLFAHSRCLWSPTSLLHFASFCHLNRCCDESHLHMTNTHIKWKIGDQGSGAKYTICARGMACRLTTFTVSLISFSRPFGTRNQGVSLLLSNLPLWRIAGSI